MHHPKAEQQTQPPRPVVLDDPQRDAKNARAVAITRARQASPDYCQRCSRLHASGPCKTQRAWYMNHVS